MSVYGNVTTIATSLEKAAAIVSYTYLVAHGKTTYQESDDLKKYLKSRLDIKKQSSSSPPKP